MSVTELMVSICIVAVISTVAVPFYISAVQQGRVVSLILPRLHLLEANVGIFYMLHGQLPSHENLDEVLENLNVENLDIAISSGSITLTINAPDKGSKLNVLDGHLLIASPVMSKKKVVGWHLDGELADRLQINY